VPEAGKDYQYCSNTGNVILTDTGEDASKGIGLDGGVDRSRGQRGIQAEQVSNITGDVGGSHGSSRHGVGSSVIPGGDDVGTYGIGEMACRTVKTGCVPGAQMSTTEPKLE